MYYPFSVFELKYFIVIHDDFIGAYGLDVPNMIDPLDIIWLSKTFESFIWDPGPISYY